MPRLSFQPSSSCWSRARLLPHRNTPPWYRSLTREPPYCCLWRSILRCISRHSAGTSACFPRLLVTLAKYLVSWSSCEASPGFEWSLESSSSQWVGIERTGSQSAWTCWRYRMLLIDCIQCFRHLFVSIFLHEVRHIFLDGKSEQATMKWASGSLRLSSSLFRME